MYTFGSKSKAQLSTAHPFLQRVMSEAIKLTDFSVLEGARSRQRQEDLFDAGKSKARPGESKHNEAPFSMAVDVAPYPIDWENEARFFYLAGVVLGIAKVINQGRRVQGLPEHKVRWGGDWNMNGVPIPDDPEERFRDYGHFEIA